MSTNWKEAFAEFGDTEEMQLEIWPRLVQMQSGWAAANEAERATRELVANLCFLNTLLATQLCSKAQEDIQQRLRPAIAAVLGPNAQRDLESLLTSVEELDDRVRMRRELEGSDASPIGEIAKTVLLRIDERRNRAIKNE